MCEGDFDCPGNLNCLPGTLPWAPPWANSTFCDCDAVRNGFLRETPEAQVCSVLGKQALYQIATILVLSTIALFLILQALILLVTLSLRKKMKMNNIVTTLSLLLAANTVNVCFSYIKLATYFKPLEHVYKVNGRKVHPLDPVAETLIIIGQSLGNIAVTNLPLVWTEIVLRTTRFDLTGKGAWKIRAGVRFYQLLVFVVRIVTFGVEGKNAVPISTASALLGVVGVIIVFAVARHWFVRLFRSAAVQIVDSVLLLRINMLTNVVITLQTFAVVTVSVYIFFLAQSVGLQCVQGQVCGPLILRDLAAYFGLGTSAACQHYCALSLGFYGNTEASTPSNGRNQAEGATVLVQLAKKSIAQIDGE